MRAHGGVAPPAGAHGGDGARLARALGVPVEEVLDLSASLNPVAPDITRAVAGHLGALHRYPDATLATAALAATMGVDGDRLVLTNGGAEAIALVAAELGRGWVDEPDFGLYRRHIPVVERGAPRFRSNPHNPTGRLAGDDERAGVWDEAFYPLATGTWTRGDDDAVVVGSLTKLLACPGLRIGYALCRDGAEAQRVARRQPAWSVNGLACAVLPEVLRHIDLRAWADAVAGLRRGLVDLLEGFGLGPLPSDANWVLVPAAGWIREPLARQGVLVRDCASFGLEDHVRVAVPDGSGLDRLGAALQQAVGTDGARP